MRNLNVESSLNLSRKCPTTLDAPTAGIHDEHDDSITKNALWGIHRELRVFVDIVRAT
jgi:hypothetical protein